MDGWIDKCIFMHACMCVNIYIRLYFNLNLFILKIMAKYHYN